MPKRVLSAAIRFEDGFAAYEHGDHRAALEIWLPLAEQGDAEAQFNLGVMHSRGQGVPEDHTEAVKWFRNAGNRGHAAAQFNLGVIYANGEGVPQDDSEAEKWFRRAAEKGFAEAQFNVGLMYEAGLGAPQDYVRAHVWLSLAAALGFADAVTKADNLASRMTPDQIVEAQRLAAEWKFLIASKNAGK